MTKVDFYILSDTAHMERYRMACRIVEKAYFLDHRVHVHTDSAEITSQLDELLWTFRDRSFIPHEIEPKYPNHTPVTLGHGWIPEHCDVLVNLATGVPKSFNHFNRVAEIINQDEQCRESGRARYRFYRDHGYSLTHHEIQL